MSFLSLSNKQTVLAIIYVNIALYALCFQMQRPLEPFLVEQLGKKRLENGGGQGDTGEALDSAAQYTKLQSFFSMVQVVGSLASGPLLDRFGAKGGFFINFLCSAMSYYILSLSTSMDVLYFSKIPSVFQAGYLCGQLAISQITEEGQERTGALGKLTTAYLVGNFIGPALGGVLGADGDYFYGAKVATVGSLLSCVIVLFMPLTEATSDFRKLHSSDGDGRGEGNGGGDGQELDKSKPKTANSVSGGYQLVLQSVWLLLSCKLISGVANALTGAVLPLVLKNVYLLDEKQMGYSMSLMPLINAFLGLALTTIISLAGGNIAAISLCLSSSASVYIVQAMLTHPSIGESVPGLAAGATGAMVAYLTTQLLLSMPQFVLASAITSESTSRVASNLQGTLLGMEHGLFAAVRIATPTLGASILNAGGVTAVSGTCALIYCSIAALFTIYRERLVVGKEKGKSSASGKSIDKREKTAEEYKRR